ncbi:MAG: hypothetical protein V2I36_06135 [Desulfopila sp.]|nr:hypothetical protein [Desulfopila sp.]
MHYEVQKVTVTEEFKQCPTCGYLDGFHSMLKPGKDRWQVFFICPSCHDVFDVGLTLPLDK